MKIKQTVFALIAVVMVGGAIAVAPTVAAQEECAGVDTAIISCDQTGGENTNYEQSGVWGLLILTLNIMTAGVGIAAVGGVIWAAILYSSASDSAEQVKKAKDILRNVAIGLISYALMYIFLNFLIPGGIFT